MPRILRFLVLVPMLLSAAPPAMAQGSGASAAGGRGSGTAVAIGGALRYDNDAVWQRLVDLAGGQGARYVVFAMASSDPDASAAATIDALKRRGAVAEQIRIGTGPKGADAHAGARDPALVARVAAARGIYFTGGAQERIIEALYDDAGQPTPVLAAIWAVYRAGGVVAGSSAGAAIMSTVMFRDAQDVLAVLKNGVNGLTMGRQIDRGLGFVGPTVFVDQHFLKRGRLGRMLPFMQKQGDVLGIGVDENTAAIFRGDAVEVIGGTGALVVDLRDATTDPRLGEFNVRNARLTYLDHGDAFDLATRTASPSPQKLSGTRIDPNASSFKPYFSEPAFYPDILGDSSVVHLMAHLIDSRQRESIGLAFGPADSAKAELGFEFRFYKGADSLGWYTGAFGGEDYSIANIHLDVTPVRLARPLYRPLEAP